MRVGFVPTMGALHEGHLSLVDEAKRRAAFVAVSIFVNPLQFGPKEDLDRYPRTLDADLELLRARGVDVAFAPAPGSMYPPGFDTRVEVGALTESLEGAFRPDHFRGVTTVVAKLFGLVGSSVALFGRKDYQQWRVLERMARDLDMPVEVVGMPTVRERDGLALSSRNRYLDESSRGRALAIARGLRAAWDAYHAGERDPAELEVIVAAPVGEAFDRVDYVAARDAETLEVLVGESDTIVLLVAAHLGRTRLIDSCVLGGDARP